MNNIFSALTDSMSAILYYERLFKRIPPFHDSFESKFNIFRARCTRRYNLSEDHIMLIQLVKEIIPEKGRYADTSKADTGSFLKGDDDKYIFEPTPKEAVELLIPHLVTMQLYHLVLEANASEHSARRVAMKTASDNAAELSEKLTLQFNKARQAAITREVSEITGGMEAMAV